MRSWCPRKGTPQRHERTQRPYHCKHVVGGLLKKRDIKVHVRSHSGEKPYQSRTSENCFYSERRSSNPRKIPHWREAIPVQNMWQVVYTKGKSTKTWKIPHCRGTIPMQILWLVLYPMSPWKILYWREATGANCVRSVCQREDTNRSMTESTLHRRHISVKYD